MRKGFLIVLAVALVAALAAPAMAGTDINGFYRAKAWMSNFKDAGDLTGGNPTIGKDAPTNSFVEQRLRLKISSGEENVKAVAFFEIDYSAWGDAAGMTKNDAIFGTGNGTSGGLTGSYANTLGGTTVPGTGAGRNTGGALGADRINLETKNVYVWFKIPNTPVDVTVGMQNQSDAYAGLLFGAADMAGIFVNAKLDPVTLTFGWAKLYENITSRTDDSTLYIAAAKISPVKEVKVGLNFYYLQDDSQTASEITAINPVGNLPTDPTAAGPFFKRKIYTPGVDVAFNAGPATISGFALYQFGKFRDFVSTSSGLSDVKVQGYAADVRADLNAGPGKAFVEALYISGGDTNGTASGQKYKSIVTLSDVNASPGGNSFFARTDMGILLVNGDDINMSQSVIGSAGAPAGGSSSPSNGGRGLMHVAAGFTMTLADKLTGKVGAGYLRANKLLTTDTTRKGKTEGTELNANVNYTIMKGLDFGVYGAYAWLGDYFKSNAAGAVDPDNAFEAHMRLNYAF